MESMASDEALEASTPWEEVSAEATPSQSLEDYDDCESRSGGTEGIEFTSDDSQRVKVAAAAAVVGITFDFGASGVGKARITSMENNALLHEWVMLGLRRGVGAGASIE
jgi:hypothetical protein